MTNIQHCCIRVECRVSPFPAWLGCRWYDNLLLLLLWGSGVIFRDGPVSFLVDNPFYLLYELIMITPKPQEKTWDSAKLYKVDFFDVRFPVSGTRLVWAVVGRKWVRICLPIVLKKFRVSRKLWDEIPTELLKE